MNWIKNIGFIISNGYMVKNDAIIFNYKFNEKPNTKLISGFKKLIFSDYKLNKKYSNTI